MRYYKRKASIKVGWAESKAQERIAVTTKKWEGAAETTCHPRRATHCWWRKENSRRIGSEWMGGFVPSWPSDGHSCYLGILVLIFDVQSNLDNVIRCYIYYLENALSMGFFEQKEAFLSKKEVFGSKRSFFYRKWRAEVDLDREK